MYTVITSATSQGPSLRKAKRSMSTALGCCGNSSLRPKRKRTRWLTQISSEASRLQIMMISAKAKMMGTHSLAGSIKATSSSLARPISSLQREVGLSLPENCFSRSARVLPIKPNTPISASGWAFLVASRSFLRSASNLLRCWSFSRFLITSSSDWPNGSVGCVWVLSELGSRLVMPTAWAEASGSKVSRQISSQ